MVDGHALKHTTVTATGDIAAAAAGVTHVFERVVFWGSAAATVILESGTTDLLKAGCVASDTIDLPNLGIVCVKGAACHVEIGGGGAESCTVWYYSIVDQLSASPVK